jgi:hypothetical protein
MPMRRFDATQGAELSERAYDAFCCGLITRQEFGEINELAGFLVLARYVLEKVEEGSRRCADRGCYTVPKQ